MFDSVYGLEISTKEDKSQHAREIVDLTNSIFIPGWDAVKSIPFIHLFPSWFPGGRLRIFHERLREVFDATVEDSWAQSMKAMVSYVTVAFN